MNRTYALITGGSSGIGKALAFEFAKRGHDIAIVALANTGQKETISELESAYDVSVKSLELDLTSTEAIPQIMEWIKTEGMQIQALANNAGMGYADEFSSLSNSFICTLLDLNIKATVLLTHALIPELKKNNVSYILNLSSAAAFYSMPFKSIYAASKGFVLDFTLSLREEVREHGINITAVCPAGVITSKEIRARISDAGFIAKKSALEPSEVADLAVKAMLKKKSYIVPGKLATLMSYARFIVPSGIQRRLIAKSFKK